MRIPMCRLLALPVLTIALRLTRLLRMLVGMFEIIQCLHGVVHGCAMFYAVDHRILLLTYVFLVNVCVVAPFQGRVQMWVLRS